MEEPYVGEKYIEHLASNGLKVSAERGDLKGGVIVHTDSMSHGSRVGKAMLEFAAWHATQVHPRLKSFAGYDAIQVSTKSIKDSSNS